MEEFRRRLKRSMEKVGLLYPILVSKDGVVIDGRERLLADESAPIKRVPWVDTPEKLIRSRLHANVVRKSRDELREDLTEAAETLRGAGMKPGNIVPWIVEETGFASSYIRSLLPKEFKAQEMSREPRRATREIIPEEGRITPPKPERKRLPTEPMEFPTTCPKCGAEIRARVWGRYAPRALELAKAGGSR